MAIDYKKLYERAAAGVTLRDTEIARLQQVIRWYARSNCSYLYAECVIDEASKEINRNRDQVEV